MICLMYMCTMCITSTQKRMLDPLELDIQVLVSCDKDAGDSSKETSTKSSPDPTDYFYTLLNTGFYCPILSLGVLVTEHLMHTG